MKKRLASLGCLGFAAASLAGFAAGIFVVKERHESTRDKRIEYRHNGAPPRRPAFMRIDRPCRRASAQGIRLDHKMLEAAKIAFALRPKGQSPAQHYIVSYFAWHYGQTDSHNNRCPPSGEIVVQLAPLLDLIGWPLANTQPNDLQLVERLPPSKIRAEGLAHIAFLGWIPPSELKGHDSRPYARILLGDQGKFAVPWSDRAISEIDGDSRLGTSAAYLAIATEPRTALPKVERVMSEKLRRSQERALKNVGLQKATALRSDDADRLIELGYALARAGSKAQSYSRPIIEMLDKEIARSVPPFGLMPAKPTEFCAIASQIGGATRSVALTRPFCQPGFKGGDGRPQPF